MTSPAYYIDRAANCADATSIAVRNEHGEVIGAVAFKDRIKHVHIHYLGSTQRGVGRQLVEMVESMSSGKPITVLAENDAIGFYKRLGFRVTVRGELVSRMRKSHESHS